MSTTSDASYHGICPICGEIMTSKSHVYTSLSVYNKNGVGFTAHSRCVKFQQKENELLEELQKLKDTIFKEKEASYNKGFKDAKDKMFSNLKHLLDF